MTIQGIRHYNASQAARYLRMDRRTLNKRVRPHIEEVELPNYAWKFFREADLDKFK